MAMPPFFQKFVDGPRLPKILLGVVGAVAIAAAGWFLLLSPVQARIAQLTARNAALHAELVTHRAQVAELARFRRELAELENTLVALKEKLPTDRETPALYRAVSDAAHQAGLGVSLFQPRESKSKDYVNEIPISVIAEGGYHQLGEFFERVSRLPRVVTVGELKVTGLTKSKNTVKADLTLATFTYRAAGPAPTKPGAPAPKPAAAMPATGSGGQP